MARRVPIGGRKFRTKQSAAEVVRKVLWRYELSKPMNEEDAPFIGQLFRFHSGYVQKVGGRTINRFEVHPNKGGTRCFYAVFTDGSIEEFSFKKCIGTAAA